MRVLLILTASLWTAHVYAAHDAADAPTFDKEVAPILYKNCVNCHRVGGMPGADALLTYEDAKPLAQKMAAAVKSRRMPPWPADPLHSLKFANDPRLNPQDVDVLVRWANGGAPRGNDADLPAVPVAAEGWLNPNHRAPDAVVSLPEVSLPANGEIPYIQQRIKVPLKHDAWIVALQMRPSNAALVHHMGVTEVLLAPGISPADLDRFAAAARQMGIPDSSLADVHPAVTDPVNAQYDMLAVYTPGTTFESYGDGRAKLLKAGPNAYINFNIHYTTSGKADKDRSQLALWLQSTPPEHQLFRAPAAVGTIIANGQELLTDAPGTKAEGTDFAIPPIPAYTARYELIGITAYVQPTTIYQLQPHAHMRASDFTYIVAYPDGREVIALTVPRYDFHWQLAYSLETPLRLPAGSKLIVIAHYDNSPKNVHLRALGNGELARHCGPDKVAYFRRENQSWDEMFSPLIQYSVDGAVTASAAALPFAQAVGCVQKSVAGTWQLVNASVTTVSGTSSTSSAALRSAALVPFGSETVELLSAGVFNPQRLGNHKVAAKGVLIRGGTVNRLNVTSLQPVAGACS